MLSEWVGACSGIRTHRTQAELDWATRVLASGDGAVAIDGATVVELRLRARAILAACEGLG